MEQERGSMIPKMIYLEDMRNFICWPRIIKRKRNESSSEIIHPRKAEKRGKNLGHGSHFESFHTDIEFCALLCRI